MRQHFIFAMKGGDKVPSGGSAFSWLEYYKLNPENEEVFLPFPLGTDPAFSGDMLWVMVEGDLIARVPVLRTQLDAINGRVEVWYDSAKIYRYTKRYKSLFERICSFFRKEYSTGQLPPGVGEQWLRTK
jgi:hypothetical protein